MAMLGNAAGMEAALKAPDDMDGDNDQMVTCPECGANFAPGDTDNDAGALQAGGAAAPGQGMPPEAPAQPQQAATGSACPECGGKIGPDGKCASCGYSAQHSPMRANAQSFVEHRPERLRHEKPNVDEIYDQGKRVREHMRRPAPYGRP